MTLTIQLDTCTIIARIFDSKSGNVDWSYAILISAFTGQVYRLTIPELVKALEMVAKTK